MLPMQRQQPLSRDQTEPKENWHRRVGLILGGAFRHVQVGLLEHVGWVEPALEPMVQTQLYHLPQSVSVAREELGQRALVACFNPSDQSLGFTLVSGHGCFHK
jgi:hypothetical protein